MTTCGIYIIKKLSRLTDYLIFNILDHLTKKFLVDFKKFDN